MIVAAGKGTRSLASGLAIPKPLAAVLAFPQSSMYCAMPAPHSDRPAACDRFARDGRRDTSGDKRRCDLRGPT